MSEAKFWLTAALWGGGIGLASVLAFTDYWLLSLPLLAISWGAWRWQWGSWWGIAEDE